MKAYDFYIKYDPEKDTQEEIGRRIFKSIILNVMRYKKPRVVGIFGDSGEGKSYAALRIMEIILEEQGLEPIKYLKDINVFTPTEYPEKIKRLLDVEELKKVNMLIVHEARNIVKAKLWHKFVTQAIADVNAMSRAIKRICFIIVSQFIRDITTDVRYTLNLYITADRPLGQQTRLRIYTLWKDDRDLEKPRLRKRRLQGWLVQPNGRRTLFRPKYIIIRKPSLEVYHLFDKLDFESKQAIIKNKLEQVVEEIKMEFVTENIRIEAMVNYYANNPEQLKTIGRRLKNKWVTNTDFCVLHNLLPQERKIFEEKLFERLVQKPLIDETDNMNESE